MFFFVFVIEKIAPEQLKRGEVRAVPEKMERKILGVSLKDRIRNEKLRKMMGVKNTAISNGNVYDMSGNRTMMDTRNKSMRFNSFQSIDAFGIVYKKLINSI